MSRLVALAGSLLFFLSCSNYQAPSAPQEVSTESGPAIRLSYVAKPTTNK